jgi:chromate reductase
MKKVLALSGSTRTNSTNHFLINAISRLASGKFEVTIYDGLSDLPHFNPDQDTKHPPESVKVFRKLLRQSDGILICTPEYAMGVPGTLKNAIDWTVSSCEFSHKPTALITASSMGEQAHASLLGTLKIIEARIDTGTSLLIPYAKTKINEQGITDKETLEQVHSIIWTFSDILTNSQ